MFHQLDFGWLLICYTWVSIELITVEINQLFGLYRYFACLIDLTNIWHFDPMLTYFTQVPAHLPIGFGFYAKNAPIKNINHFLPTPVTIPPFSLWSNCIWGPLGVGTPSGPQMQLDQREKGGIVTGVGKNGLFLPTPVTIPPSPSGLTAFGGHSESEPV